jgi:hypothetical protein
MAARKRGTRKTQSAPAKRRRAATTRRPAGKATRRGSDNPLGELRRQAQTVIKRLQRVGWQRINAIERQIEALNRQRQALVNELGAVVRGVGGKMAGVGRAAAGGRAGGGRRARVDWPAVFAKLPRGSFKASDVRKIVPGVAAGTLSQRLTAWVKEKKLRRSGSRRGTRYTRA